MSFSCFLVSLGQLLRKICYFLSCDHDAINNASENASQAFNSRDLIIPCRSKFLPPGQLAEAVRRNEKHVYEAIPNWTHTIGTGLRAAHLRWLIEGYKDYRKNGLDMQAMPESMKEFKSGVLLIQSFMRPIIDDIIEPSENAEDILHLDRAWEKVKDDSRFIKKTEKRDFVTAFKLYVNEEKPGSFDDGGSKPGDDKKKRRKLVMGAKGWRFKTQKSGYDRYDI